MAPSEKEKLDYTLDVAQRLENEPADADIDLRRMLRIVWRRKVVLSVPVVVVVALVLWGLSLVPPRYTAEAEVQIVSRQPLYVGIDVLPPGLSGDAGEVAGEVELIRSTSLAETVIDVARLAAVPEFNAAIRPAGPEDPKRGGVLSWVKRRVPGISESAAIEPADRSRPGDDSEYLVTSAVVRGKSSILASYDRQLKVSVVGRSNVVSIRFTSLDPGLAARVANAAATTYVQETLDRKFDAIQQAEEWINGRLISLRSDVETSEENVETFRSDEGLVQGVQAPLHVEQISRLNAELAVARGNLAAADARIVGARRSVESEDLASVGEVLASPIIQSLLLQRAEIRRQFADASSRFGEQHPALIDLRSSVNELDGLIRSQIKTIVSNLESEVRVARARVSSLEQAIGSLEDRTSVANQASVQLRTLERDATANRNLYEVFLYRYKEAAAQDGLLQPDARIISYASVPLSPSSPKSAVILLLAFVASSIGGLFLAFVVDSMDVAGFRSPIELKRALGITSFAMLPKLHSSDPSAEVLRNPHSAFSEGIRYLGAAFGLGRDRSPGARTLTVTSSVPGEGKSTVAVALAQSLAGDAGVVIIDCDMRRPSVHSLLGIPNDLGLADFLSGGLNDLPSILRGDSASNMKVITSGRQLRQQPLLASERFRQLLEEVASLGVETIILDLPPVLATSDAFDVMQYSDALLFVVRWERTRREIVKNAFEMLSRGKPPENMGAVINHVNVKRHLKYSYGDMGQYYGEYARDYASSRR